MAENSFDLLIIGGGMAGLSAGCSASISALGNPSAIKIGLIEKNPLPGRKLLLSGSGQCNVTHDGSIRDFLPHYGEKERFIAPALTQFSNESLRKFLADEGVPTYTREDGKFFPCSMRAGDVLAAMTGVCRRNGVQILTGSPVLAVERDKPEDIIENREPLFHLTAANGEKFSARRVIFAAGGSSFPKTGSTGDAFRWAKRLGHKIVPPQPALTPIFTDGWSYADCAGIALGSPRIELFHQGKKTKTFSGEILFTHRGLSGPAILDASRFIRPGDELKVTLVPFAAMEEWESALMDALKNHPKRTAVSLFSDWNIPARLIRTLFIREKLPLDAVGATLKKEDRRRILETVYRWPFTVSHLGGWNEAMTTTGGVALSDVNRKTMESRIVPGLYFAGETLDIDGDCGGYNLQWAWSSGSMAGKNGVKSIFKTRQKTAQK